MIKPTKTAPRTMVVLAALILLALTSHSAMADDGSARVSSEARAGFQMSPMVNYLDARPGQVVPFEFRARSRGGDNRVTVQLVGLTQEESGRINAAADVVPEGVELKTPAELVLSTTDAAAIRGTIRVPADKSYFAFGVLVTDEGRQLQPTADPGERRASVKFVTRYLLRVEVTVHGGRGATVADLVLGKGELVDREGRAVAQISVDNEAASAVEFEARARLVRAAGDTRTPVGPFFSLHHPIRANMPEPDRYAARVLGHSEILLEAPVPDPVFEGEYELEVRVVTPTRRAQERFPVIVAEDAFPAQRAVVARAVRAIQISPAAIELSNARAGNRLATVALRNTGPAPVTVRVSPTSLAGEPGEGISIRPAAVTLAPGRERNVMVAMSGRVESNAHYLLLHCVVRPHDGGAGGAVDIPVGINVPADAAREAEVAEARWVEDDGAFVVSVENTGETHLVLDGRLQLSDAFERSVTLRSGYGRWLLPGSSTELYFKPTRPLPPAAYDARFSIRLAPSQRPIEGRSEIELP